METFRNVRDSTGGVAVLTLQNLQTVCRVTSHQGVQLLAIITPHIVLQVLSVQVFNVLCLPHTSNNHVTIRAKVAVDIKLCFNKVQDMLSISLYSGANGIKVDPDCLLGGVLFD